MFFESTFREKQERKCCFKVKSHPGAPFQSTCESSLRRSSAMGDSEERVRRAIAPLWSARTYVPGTPS
uniref:Uncharacterized protein n=1 Tax=Utricularia reniformis TaxID=192314 RepID=A0A1Y0AZ87_9LAMI|nr:hypothetical protein AEK19_MT0218 [Utricularia reniformis]ART30496.1 hypothetical protein AEK19_MT0218 [Utricularia reniformis]